MSVSKATPVRTRWFKSSFSRDATSCVEVRFAADHMVEVRDSKYDGLPADQPVITIPVSHWAEFLAIATGRVETSTQPDVPAIENDPATGNTTLRDATGTRLVYTSREWSAFTAGITAGEFTPALV